MSEPARVAEELAEAMAKIQKELNETLRNIWAKYSALYPDKLRVYDPLFDIEDRGDSIVVYVDVPGFKRNEIRIRVTEDSLEIIAEKSEEKIREESDRKYLQRQRLYRQIYKKIELPVKVRPEQARARLEEGVLMVMLPKSGAEREVQLNVE
ncbi:MAG: Hsp20/alpha crystallin family protein [Infirmifilum sp.]